MIASASYVELKLSWELHKCPPDALTGDARKSLAGIVERHRTLESLILSSPEALVMMVSDEAVSERLRQICARYDSDEAMNADLASVGLDRQGLEAELARDLRIEQTLENVGRRALAPSETDAEIYYRVNVARFSTPERRSLQHILLTYTGRAECQTVQRTLSGIRDRALSPDGFAAQALRHSQCPTALERGQLGVLPRGKLYKELDTVAFALAEGEVSEPVESPIGWHLLRCEAIFPATTVPFEFVQSQILELLATSREKRAQKEWLRQRALDTGARSA